MSKFKNVSEMLAKAWETKSDDAMRVAQDALEELSVKPHGNLEVKKELLKKYGKGKEFGGAYYDNSDKKTARRADSGFMDDFGLSDSHNPDPLQSASRTKNVTATDILDRYQKHKLVAGPERSFGKLGEGWGGVMNDPAYLDKLSDNAIPIATAGATGAVLLGSGDAEASTGQKQAKEEQASALENFARATGVPQVIDGYKILNKHVINPYITKPLQEKLGKPSVDAIASGSRKAFGNEYLTRAAGSVLSGDKAFEDYAMSDDGRRDVNNLETGPLGETGTAFATGLAKYAGEEPFPLAGIGDSEDDEQAKMKALKKMKGGN